MIDLRAAPVLRLPLLGALLFLLCLSLGLPARASSTPPKPGRYITDESRVINPSILNGINAQLVQFEQATSNQIVVAIYPSLPPDAEIAQYATETYHAWGIGQKGKDNGALLMVFTKDHKIFICTGRGLEGALPDSICKDIVSQVIVPRFRQGDYAGGVQSGINAMFAATRGEYKGAGTTVRQRQGNANNIPDWVVIVGFIVFFLLCVFVFPRFQGAGGAPFIFTGGGFGGGDFGGGGGGGGGGGDSGGFSGGGGDSAGGGAGGSW